MAADVADYGHSVPALKRDPLFLPLARRSPLGSMTMLRWLAQSHPHLRDYPIAVKASDIRLRADLRENVYALLYRWGNFPHQAGLDAVLQRFVEPGATVFDVGANIGYPAVILSGLVGERGRVVAFEPAPKTFALLQRSLADIPNITLVDAALAEHAGNAPFFIPVNIDTAGFRASAGSQEVRVRTETLDRMVEAYGMPDFLKVDVEGFEPAVFAGGQELLREARTTIAFEALSEAERDRSMAVIREASGGQYDFHRIARDGSLVSLSARGSRDYLALPRR